MASASLIVRISADMNDFSRQLDKMTRDVDKAAKRIENLGKSMTTSITVPVALATAVLAKFAAENDEVAIRMERSFGSAVGKVRGQLHELMKVVPKTGTDLDKMAVSLNNVAKGLDLAAPQSAELTTSVMRMAAELGAFSGEGMDAALEAITKGLMGQTRGLKQMGVVLDEAMIKQEAYTKGLLGTGRELTPLGKALATYSILLKKSGDWTGSAAALNTRASQSWKMVLRDLEEMADQASNVLIPALRATAGVLREFFKAIAETPPWILKLIGGLVLAASTIGPFLWLVAKLTVVINTLTAAVTLLSGPAALGGLVAVLAAPQVIGAIAVIAVALAGLTYLWYKYSKAVEEVKPPKLEAPTSLEELLKGAAGKTDFQGGDPLQLMQKKSGLLISAFERAVATGDVFEARLSDIAQLSGEVYSAWDKTTDKFGELGQGLLDIYFRLKAISTISAVAAGKMSATRGSQILTSDATIAENLAKQDIGARTDFRTRTAALEQSPAISAMEEALLQFAERAKAAAYDLEVRRVTVAQPTNFNQIRADAGVTAQENIKNMQASLLFRAELLRLPPAFDATRLAVVEWGEDVRNGSEQMKLAWAKFKLQTTGKGLMESASTAMAAGVSMFLAAINPVAVIFMAIGKVLEPIMKLLDMVMEPLAALGQIIAIMLIPIMKPLFQALKLLGIVTSFLGEMMARITAAIAQAVGGLVVAIGKVISKIPFLGGVGHSVEKFGKSILEFSDSSKQTAHDLMVARKQLQDLKFGETYDALGNLTNAANDAAEALLNVPTGFRIALERFNATAVVDTTTGGYPAGGTPIGSAGTGGGGGGGGGDGGDGGYGNGSPAFAAMSPTDTPIVLVMDGVVVAKTVVRNLQRQSQARFGTTLRWSEVMP